MACFNTFCMPAIVCAIIKLLMVSPNNISVLLNYVRWLVFLQSCNLDSQTRMGGLPCVKVFPGQMISLSVTRD